ncbi:MAG: N-acetyltransferase, partial [Proteobacteria bacterium]
MQPTLHTPRLTLEPFQQSDLEDIFAYAKDPAVAEMVTWPAHESLQDSQAFLDWIRQSTSDTKGNLFYVWAMRLKESNKVIGSMSFSMPDPETGQFDYALSRTHWNTGLTTETAKCVFDWAFSTIPELKKFQAMCIEQNHGSRRVMEKVGLSLKEVREK